MQGESERWVMDALACYVDERRRTARNHDFCDQPEMSSYARQKEVFYSSRYGKDLAMIVSFLQPVVLLPR